MTALPVRLSCMVALLCAIASNVPAQTRESLTGVGVSRALARARAATIADVRYDLRLSVVSPDTAAGELVASFTRRGGGDVIMDFRGRSLSSVSVNGHVAPLHWNGHHLRIPAAAFTSGRNTVSARFSAAIAPAGASIIRYHDSTDGAEYLYTLLVPADANLLFPCFDQPDLKARVTLTLVTPPSWNALANGMLTSVDSTARSSTWHFAESLPISTYLIAFAAGPWQRITRTNEGRPVTLYVRASRAREVDADTVIALNARAAHWLEGYFARPFPFPKLDVLLAPAFPFGGMEHPGAIFYNEDRFIFRERPTLSQRLGRASTIYHEVAHQWFGDLVTMKWFDDLWLKEGFATYMAAKMQDAMDPGTDAWKTFYLRNKPLAYAVDATAGTSAISQPLENLDQAKSNYGPIVYNKAPGILKQLNYLVGESAFQRGLQHFLGAHAYANATWRDLLTSIGGAAHRDLQPWGRHYIVRAGMPVIVQRAEPPLGTDPSNQIVDVALSQRPASSVSGAGAWPIRTELLFVGDPTQVGQPVPIELGGSPRRVPAWKGTRFAFANAGDMAYAEVELDPVSRAYLVDHVGDVSDAFLRAMLWGALWDDVRASRLDPARYVRAVLRDVPNERDEQIVPVLLGRVTRAMESYLVPSRRDSLMEAVEWRLASGFQDTTRSYGIRRAHLDAFIRVARTPAALAIIDAMLDSSRLLGEPLRPPTRWSIVTHLVARGAPSAPVRFARERERDATSEGRRYAFIAGAAEPAPATKRAYFARYFADTALNEDWVTASLGAFNDVDASSPASPFLRPSLDSLRWVQRNRRIFFLGSWLDAFVGAQSSPEALAIVRQYLRDNPRLPADLRKKVLQAEDELARVVHSRATYDGVSAPRAPAHRESGAARAPRRDAPRLP